MHVGLLVMILIVAGGCFVEGVAVGIALSRLFDRWLRDAQAQRAFETWLSMVRQRGLQWPAAPPSVQQPSERAEK